MITGITGLNTSTICSGSETNISKVDESGASGKPFVHDYSDSKKGFVAWKGMLEEKLIQNYSIFVFPIPGKTNFSRSMKKYPYHNLDLKTIKGEKWKDISDLEGYYQISSYGRIKRLEYEMEYKNGAIYLKEEKIIKPAIVKQINKFKKDHTYFLTNRVIFNKRKNNFTIARIVYCYFVEQFNYEDSRIVIICKDGDNFNIRPSNLRKVTISQKQQRIVERNRFQSPYSTLSDNLRRKQRTAIIRAVSKQVTQYTRNGKKVKTYPSMAAAQRATGIFASSIGNRAAGNGKTAGGFIWRWGNGQSKV